MVLTRQGLDEMGDHEGGKTNEMVLSYGDVVLRKSDLDILDGPLFLNDRIIEFYFTHLASKYTSQDIAFISPSVSFWIANCDDVGCLRDCLAPLKLREKELVFFTVNDNGDVNQAEGGSHWSLLVYYRKMNSFCHHDSLNLINWSHAEELAASVVGLLTDKRYAASVKFKNCPTPQQKNVHDCGLYVLAIAEIICDWHEDSNKCDWFSAVEEKISDGIGVAQMRSIIKQLILDLKKGNGCSSS